MRVFGAVEAGGTKFVCGIGSLERGSLEQVRIPTGAPADTLEQVIRFFELQSGRYGGIAALGIGSFGPLDLDPRSATFGRLTTTPKPGWQGVDILGRLTRRLGVPATIDTDVNAAALAEARLAFEADDALLAYVTVGTGIGVGFAQRGGIARRSVMPEAGHLMVRRHPLHENFAGVCPYHADCVEGLASGPAIMSAWGSSLDRLPPEHPAWTAQADYIGQLCAALLLIASPDRIVIGGGVFNLHGLYGAVRARTRAILNGYRPDLDSEAALEGVVRAPASAMPPGLAGAYALAQQASRGPELPKSS
jgi:fructokinase